MHEFIRDLGSDFPERSDAVAGRGEQAEPVDDGRGPEPLRLLSAFSKQIPTQDRDL